MNFKIIAITEVQNVSQLKTTALDAYEAYNEHIQSMEAPYRKDVAAIASIRNTSIRDILILGPSTLQWQVLPYAINGANCFVCQPNVYFNEYQNLRLELDIGKTSKTLEQIFNKKIVSNVIDTNSYEGYFEKIDFNGKKFDAIHESEVLSFFSIFSDKSSMDSFITKMLLVLSRPGFIITKSPRFYQNMTEKFGVDTTQEQISPDLTKFTILE